MKHIMIVINKMDFGGAQRVVANLANYLNRYGIKVDIVSISSAPSVYPIDRGITQLTLRRHEQGKTQISRAVGSIFELRKLVLKRNPDVVLSFLTDINILVIPALINLDVPLIVSERNDPKRNPTNKLKRIARRLFYRFSDGFIFQTEEAKSYFSKEIQERSIVLPNPLLIDNIPEEFKGKRRKEIVAVGRLEPQKNHKLLINAFKQVVEQYNDFTLTIYGEGSLRKELMNHVSSLGLQNYVFLPGEVKNITSKIIDSYAFVLSSDYEGMPNALMEAMACGLPCISTDCPCGGPSFLIQNGKNGLLVPVGSSEHLVDSIINLIKNPDFANRLGKEARKIISTLEPSKVFNEWLSYFEKVVLLKSIN